MPKRLILDNLPWIVPSVAIVLAATGFFDRTSAPETALAPEPAAPVATLPFALAPAPVVLPATETSVAAIEATRNATPAPSVAAIAAAVAPTPQATDTKAPLTTAALRQQKQPAALEAAPAQIAPTPVAVSPIQDAAAFFNAAQASIAQQKSCVEDLRALASQARVYFPSGGLTGDETGMSQARVLGLVAQECPGVSIEVRGHSDASGDPRVNLRLSEERAAAVIQRLSAAGIDTDRFAARGMGSQEPSGIRGPQSAAYYDRRVEFTVVTRQPTATFTASGPRTWTVSPCVAELQQAVNETKVFFTPGSITVSPADLAPVYALAEQAANCDQARLRVIGQHSDQIESFSTGRLRAVAMMATLVGSGVSSDEIIIAAPSRPTILPDQPGLSASRIDFDVILEDG